MSGSDWHERARCKGTNDPRFFPESEASERKLCRELDQFYCRACPVRVNCLGSAFRNKDTGIFAGTTTDQRRQLARTRDRAKCPQCKCVELVPVGVHDICTACGTSWTTERRDG